MAIRSRNHAWRIPWIEGPSGLESTGSHRVRHDWSDLAHTHARCYVKGRKEGRKGASWPGWPGGGCLKPEPTETGYSRPRWLKHQSQEARCTTGEKHILAGSRGLQIPTRRFPSMRSQEPRFLPQVTWRWLCWKPKGLCMGYFAINFLLYTGEQLINNVFIVSGGQQRDSAIYIYTYPFFPKLPSPLPGCHIPLTRVPCAILREIDEYLF